MNNQNTITLQLTLEETNTLLTALGGRPYSEVFMLVQKIQQQAQAQVAQPAAETVPQNGQVEPVEE